MEHIGLREAIAELRAELIASIEEAADEQLRFEVGQIELEFQIAVERVAEGSGGIRFWVVELGGRASKASTTTHRVTIPLTPKTQQGGPILTGASKVPS